MHMRNMHMHTFAHMCIHAGAHALTSIHVFTQYLQGLPQLSSGDAYAPHLCVPAHSPMHASSHACVHRIHATETGGDAISLQLLVNKANAQWVERHAALGRKWAGPKVVDARRLKIGGVDIDMYEEVGCRGGSGVCA